MNVVFKVILTMKEFYTSEMDIIFENAVTNIQEASNHLVFIIQSKLN